MSILTGYKVSSYLINTDQNRGLIVFGVFLILIKNLYSKKFSNILFSKCYFIDRESRLINANLFIHLQTVFKCRKFNLELRFRAVHSRLYLSCWWSRYLLISCRELCTCYRWVLHGSVYYLFHNSTGWLGTFFL